MALITDLRLQQLGAIGETDYAAISPWLQAKLLNDLNSVCEEIYGLGPAQWWAEYQAGETILAPVTLTGMTVTNGLKTFSGSGLTSRMHGATVQVSGQSTQNRIFQTGASTWELLMPHQGTTTSSAQITVYHDCLNLTDTTLRVIRPVMIEGLWELLPVDSAADLRQPAWYRYPSHNIVPMGSGYPATGWDRQAATPTQYYVDNTQLYGGAFIPQLRLNPLPDATYQISWQERQKFSKVADWTDTRSYIIPHAYHESVLIPLLLEKLMRMPSFMGDKDTAAADAAKARTVLAALSDVQEERDVMISVAGGY